VRYWDSTALIPLLVPEPETRPLSSLLEADPSVVVWWGTRLECASALARLEREGRLKGRDSVLAWARLTTLSDEWVEVAPAHAVREEAERMLRVHPLRAADSLQLAAAVAGASMRPATLEFVTLDQRLADAARREGFGVLPA
jgi:predicted nucleic acid-binding protein